VETWHTKSLRGEKLQKEQACMLETIHSLSLVRSDSQRITLALKFLRISNVDNWNIRLLRYAVPIGAVGGKCTLHRVSISCDKFKGTVMTCSGNCR
jgi:hypothetical protein